MSVVAATEQVNERQKLILVDRLVQRMGGDLRGRKIALWGLAFKPNTDDMREAPSRMVIRQLLIRGAQVSAYDPVASAEAMKALRLDFAQDAEHLKRFEMATGDMQALQDAGPAPRPGSAFDVFLPRVPEIVAACGLEGGARLLAPAPEPAVMT